MPCVLKNNTLVQFELNAKAWTVTSNFIKMWKYGLPGLNCGLLSCGILYKQKTDSQNLFCKLQFQIKNTEQF
jgi:hypothetical protein